MNIRYRHPINRATCCIRTDISKRTGATMVLIDWPCGQQDFPDVLPISKLGAAKTIVRKLGFVEIQ